MTAAPETRELLEPITDPRWRDFVDRAGDATIFHHPAWLELLASQYGYEFRAPCLVDGRGRVVAGIPWARIESRLTGRRLVALPFSDACAPLVAGGSEDELARVLDEQRRKTGLGLEVRARMDALDAPSPHRFWQHTLPLEPDAGAVERRARSSLRRGAAKARREGLVATRSTDRQALDTFYAMHLQTRRHQGVPTQSKRFIRGLGRIFDGGNGFVSTVTDEGRPIAAAVFLGFGGRLTYKYGASDRSALRRRPNNLLFSEVIRWACDEGYTSLDFGRTDLDNDGLRSFKRGWGADETPLHYTYAGLAPPQGGTSRAERVMGPTIRRSPPVVGRLVGAALYRHFG